jgi:acyl dehydratase
VTRLQPYYVSAHNLAKSSENKIHDDSVAQRFGFRGGLVPGVEVFAYMSHMPVAKWGRAFLLRGTMEARFTQPVYDGELACVTAEDADGGLAITVESRGEVCARGHATIKTSPPALSIDDFQNVAATTERRPVGVNTYQTGHWLGISPYTQGAAAALEYLRNVRETDPIYADQKIIHPGMLARMMNWALMENAILGPWIHVGSTIQHLNVASVDDEITVRAIVADNYERKGHKFVKLDGVIVANGRTPIARCQHTAIYQPRESEAA